MNVRMTLTAVVLTGAACIGFADDWPQFRGPGRNGISTEQGLLQQWPENGPPLAWRIEGLGGGYSAPAIAGGRIYGMSNRGDDEVVWALSEKDGKELWVTRLGPRCEEGGGQGREGPACTPTVVGDRLYVIGAAGTVGCLQASDGKIVWTCSFTEDFGGQLPRWRFSESPLVDGDKVICTPGGQNALMVALDRSTGKTIWKSSSSGSADGGAARGGGEGSNREAARSGAQAAPRPRQSNGGPVVVIAAGSKWKYLDTGASPGSGWTGLDFTDSAWKEGPAQLGYGDGDEKTRISDARDHYPTYYFRRTFEVKDPAKLKPLVLRLSRDDGAIVYINGSEVLRDNMPEGAVNRATYAAGVTPVENDFYVHDFDPKLLVAGRNIIAVEVHQASATSSDVSFDLELREKIPGRDVVGAPRSAGRSRFGGRSRSGGGRSRGGGGAGYASAIAIDFAGQRQYVQFSATTLMGVRASDGKILWEYGKPANNRRITCAAPVYHDGLVFAASAYGAGGGAVKLSKGADGTVTAEEVYFSSSMENHHGGMVVVDGCLYGANGGNSGGFLVCLDFKTGEVQWDERRGGRRARKGSVTFADGRLYYRTERGIMILIEPSREKYIERGRFDQPDRTRSPAWTYPVVANGKLYVRDQGLLLCYDVKAK